MSLYEPTYVKSVSCSLGDSLHGNCTRAIRCDCPCHIKYAEKTFSVETYRELIADLIYETWAKARSEKGYLEANRNKMMAAYALITFNCTGASPEVVDWILFTKILDAVCWHPDWSRNRYEELVQVSWNSNIPSGLDVFKK